MAADHRIDRMLFPRTIREGTPDGRRARWPFPLAKRQKAHVGL